jgi:processing peptidase subunit alpha
MSDADMATAMSALGGQIMCSSSRETIMYQSSHFHKATPLALSLISDTVQNASFLPEELDAQRAAAEYEIRELKAKPEVILPEVLHQLAYNGKGLGNQLLCPEDRIDTIDASLMRDFITQWYRPERMVIAGAGIAHEELVELAEKHFSSLKSTPTLDGHASMLSSSRPTPSIPPHLLHPQPPNMFKSLTRAASSYLYPNTPNPVSSIVGSTYTGGYRFIQDPESEFNHIYIAFEGVGIHDDDIYELATMQVLLGGGGSFSAGTRCLYFHTVILLTATHRRPWQRHVLKTIHTHPEPSRGDRPLCCIPSHIQRFVAIRVVCNIRTIYSNCHFPPPRASACAPVVSGCSTR